MLMGVCKYLHRLVSWGYGDRLPWRGPHHRKSKCGENDRQKHCDQTSGEVIRTGRIC